MAQTAKISARCCSGHAGEHEGDGSDELSAVLQVDVLVGAVSVARLSGAPSQQEVSVGELRREDLHEGDGATTADKERVFALEDFLGRLEENTLDVGGEVRRAETITLVYNVEFNLGSKDLFLSNAREGSLELLGEIFAVLVW